MPLSSDTIVAIATPPLDAALGIVRLSGKDALLLARKIFRAAPNAANAPNDFHGENNFIRAAYRGHLVITADAAPWTMPAVLYQMPAPHSYTGENVAEFILPGALVALRTVVKLCREFDARAAEPGEFTRRAFQHGRLSLREVQAVAKVLGAADQSERRAATAALHAGAASPLTRWREELNSLAAMVESELDFSEDDPAPELLRALSTRLTALRDTVGAAQSIASRRRPRDTAFPVGLIGLTNAGKSSLFNQLLRHDAAIVAPERSTTRDQITRELTLAPFRFSLTDCPGEDVGAAPLATVLRQRAAALNFDFAGIILVIDHSAAAPELTDWLTAIAPRLAAPIILVYNKRDLPAAPGLRDAVAAALRISGINVQRVCEVSAAAGLGIDDLRRELCDLARQDGGGFYHADEIAAWRRAVDALTRATAHADNLELVAFELRDAGEAFADYLGENYDETVLNNIFSRFCIGK